MKTILTAVMTLTFVAGCTPMEKIGLDWPAKRPDTPVPVVRENPIMPLPEVGDSPPVHDEDAGQVPTGKGLLGVTVASLGDPSRGGIWIETPLVSTPAKGRVTYVKSGRTVKVDLIPISGPVTAGSRLSLAAMRFLDAPLTGLPEVQVYRD
ncbi:hypothetical protein SAMN06265173_102173 [Thalassovita litoralis]|uniref:D-galactarate dehydratase n=1 Tax=Thalassovita litoralis TaxID=1010611 RepID=A0A521B6U3_9RHOB|nr:hypothetical protein [Thalassovita litoralis]SMO42819.1 hypothetical protein SAMN06265173_102173 [Thalassovita litoralis]